MTFEPFRILKLAIDPFKLSGKYPQIIDGPAVGIESLPERIYQCVIIKSRHYSPHSPLDLQGCSELLEGVVKLVGT
jgi:hypothetical protein